MAEAVDVEELVRWAFQDQKVEQVAGRLMARPGLQASPVSSLAEILALGCRVDTSSAGAMHMAVQCHEDAAVVYDAVMALPPEAWMLVIKHARSGTRPEWYEEGPGEWVQPLDSKGQPKKVWRDPHRQRGFIGYEPKVLVGVHPDTVEEGRRAYCVWWLALCDLVPMLNGEDGLEDHVALDPVASRPPWWTTNPGAGANLDVG